MSRQSTDDQRHRKAGCPHRERSRSRSPRRDDNAEAKLLNIDLGAKNRLKSIGIQMKLSRHAQKGATSVKPKITVANAFNLDSDDEPEEMPPEAKMRMRNIGRDTPTSSGPNSFGKTKHGFSDAKKVFEKNMRQAMESIATKKTIQRDEESASAVILDKNRKMYLLDARDIYSP